VNAPRVEDTWVRCEMRDNSWRLGSWRVRDTLRRFRVGSARRRRNALSRGGLIYAAVRTILAGRANDTPFALQRPMVRRRADEVLLASQANWRLFYRPYLGVCHATTGANVTDPILEFSGRVRSAATQCAVERRVDIRRRADHPRGSCERHPLCFATTDGPRKSRQGSARKPRELAALLQTLPRSV
jgi:hypothetical protein